MTILKARNFQPSDYRKLHPGGALGKRLLQVQDIMRSEEHLPLVCEGTRMSEALIEMTSKHMGCVGITAKRQLDQLQGIISDGDLRRHMSEDFLSYKVEDVMTQPPICVFPEMLASEALAYMNLKKISVIFVEDQNKKLKGVLHIHDCLRVGL